MMRFVTSGSSMTVLVLTNMIIVILSFPADLESCIPVDAVYSCPGQNCGDNDPCHCDNLCQFYGDCCPGFTPSEPVDFGHMDRSVIACITDRHLTLEERFPIFVIQACPKEFSVTRETELCENAHLSQGMLSRLPVSDKNGFLFKNVFCALCNGVHPSDIFFWRAGISCDDSDPRRRLPQESELQQAFQDHTCWIQKYLSPDSKSVLRRCIVHAGVIIDSCPAGYSNRCTKVLCENTSSVRYVFDHTSAYKNEYCFLCNNPIKGSSTGPRCKWPIKLKARGPPSSLSILIDLNINGGGKVGFETKTCNTGYIFDILKNDCEFVYTPQDAIQVGQNPSSPDEETTLQVDQNPISPNKETTNCSKHLLTTDQYEIFDNGTVVDGSGHAYSVSQYRDYGNGTIAVCVASKKTRKVHKFDRFQTIFSMVGQCISITCLILHLVIYSILPQLRNSPGKSLMALVTSLLAAQLLFLFGVGQTDLYELCVAIGVLIHYSFLASFFWMGVMSFDVWKTFSDLTVSSNQHSNRFSKYCLIGFGGPLTIVIAALLVNFIGEIPREIKPEYGDSFCWITQRKSLIIFFGAPIFSIVFINMLLYCLTLRALYKTSQETEIVQRKASLRQRFVVNVKLSFIMGLTWIFGLVAVLADNTVIWYIFLFFNTLQGAFICITFVCSKKVLRLLGEKCSNS